MVYDVTAIMMQVVMIKSQAVKSLGKLTIIITIITNLQIM